MELDIRDMLAERSKKLPRKRKLTIFFISVGVHVVLAATFLLAPRLWANDDEMPEYVAVQIVPAQMLGTTTPTPAPTPPAPREEAPPAELEPEVLPEPVREPEPVPSNKPPPPRKVTPKKVDTRPAGSERTQREGSPTGSALGTSNFGAAAVGFDNPDFTYDYYVERMLSQIREYWARPSIGGSVEAMVSFRILKDGKVVDVRIQKSSSFNSFDLAAMRAIQRASPLPPLPQSFKHDSLGVNLVVR
jgi:protein TonB